MNSGETPSSPVCPVNGWSHLQLHNPLSELLRLNAFRFRLKEIAGIYYILHNTPPLSLEQHLIIKHITISAVKCMHFLPSERSKDNSFMSFHVYTCHQIKITSLVFRTLDLNLSPFSGASVKSPSQKATHCSSIEQMVQLHQLMRTNVVTLSFIPNIHQFQRHFYSSRISNTLEILILLRYLILIN